MANSVESFNSVDDDQTVEMDFTGSSSIVKMAAITSQFYTSMDKDDIISVCSSISQTDSGIASGNTTPRPSGGRSARSPRRRSQGLSFDFLPTRASLNGLQKEEKELQSTLSMWQISGLPSPHSCLPELPLPKDEVVESASPSWQSLVTNAEGLSKRQSDQQEAIWELVTTELLYVRKLETIRLVHMAAFEDLTSRYGWFPFDTKKIFGDIEALLAANVKLWKNCFSPLVHNATGALLDATCSSLYDGFMNLEEYLEPYNEFCTNYHHLQSYYNAQSAASEHFRSLLEWLIKHPASERLTLASWVMKPVQRLTRYHILLGTISRKTEDPFQRLRLQEMINSAENFVHNINAKVKAAEEAEILNLLYDRIAGYDIFDNVTDEVSVFLQHYSLVDSHKHTRRKFVREFDVKVKRVDEPFKRTDSVLFVFSDVVMLCRKSGKKYPTNKLKIFRAPIPVQRIKVHPLRETASFLMVILDEFRTVTDAHIIYAKNPAQMESLTACIQKAAEDLDLKYATIPINRNPKNLQLRLSAADDLCESPVPGSESPDPDMAYASDAEETSTDPDPPAMPEVSVTQIEDQPEEPLQPLRIQRSRSWSNNDVEEKRNSELNLAVLFPPQLTMRSASFNANFVSQDSVEIEKADSLITDQADTDINNESDQKPEIAEIIRETSVDEPEVSDLDETASCTSEANGPDDLPSSDMPDTATDPPTPPSTGRSLRSGLTSPKTPLGHVNSLLILKRQNGFRNVKKNINKLKRHLTDTVTANGYEESPLTVAYRVQRCGSYSDGDLQVDDAKSTGSMSTGSSAYSVATPEEGSQESITSLETEQNDRSMENARESAMETYRKSLNRDFKTTFTLSDEPVGETDGDGVDGGFSDYTVKFVDEDRRPNASAGDHDDDDEEEPFQECKTWDEWFDRCGATPNSDRCDANAKVLLLASEDVEETYI